MLICACVYACVRVCMHACVRACLCVSLCVSVCLYSVCSTFLSREFRTVAQLQSTNDCMSTVGFIEHVTSASTSYPLLQVVEFSQ